MLEYHCVRFINCIPYSKALIWGGELMITGKIGNGFFCQDFFLQEAIHWVGSF